MMGWGIVEGDDQFLSDLYASQQIVRPDSNASVALEAVHQAACKKQISDTYTVITKEAIDLMINIAAGLLIPEGGWVTLAVLEVVYYIPYLGSILTVADLILHSRGPQPLFRLLPTTTGCSPWLDKILRQQFTLTGAAKTEVEDYLTPYFKTNKPGDGIP